MLKICGKMMVLVFNTGSYKTKNHKQNPAFVLVDSRLRGNDKVLLMALSKIVRRKANG